MKLFDYMWFGKTVADRRKEIWQMLSGGKAPEKVFLIVLPEAPTRVLDIMSASMLKNSRFFDAGDRIIAAAGSEEEARQLSSSILTMVHKRFGTPDIRRYIDLCEKEMS